MRPAVRFPNVITLLGLTRHEHPQHTDLEDRGQLVLVAMVLQSSHLALPHLHMFREVLLLLARAGCISLLGRSAKPISGIGELTKNGPVCHDSFSFGNNLDLVLGLHVRVVDQNVPYVDNLLVPSPPPP